MTCYFTCVEGFTFKGVVVGRSNGQTWKDYVHNCVPCHLPNVDGQIDPSLAMIPIGL